MKLIGPILALGALYFLFVANDGALFLQLVERVSAVVAFRNPFSSRRSKSAPTRQPAEQLRNHPRRTRSGSGPVPRSSHGRSRADM